jgi:hypothetical protein
MSRRIASLSGVLFVLALMASPLTGQLKTKPVTHDLEGRDNCLMCHTPGAMPQVPDVPESHKGRTVETCMWCHGPDSDMVKIGAPAIPHTLEGRDNCTMCHAPGAMPQVPDEPENHEGRTVDQCQWCHKPAGSGSPFQPRT